MDRMELKERLIGELRQYGKLIFSNELFYVPKSLKFNNEVSVVLDLDIYFGKIESCGHPYLSVVILDEESRSRGYAVDFEAEIYFDVEFMEIEKIVRNGDEEITEDDFYGLFATYFEQLSGQTMKDFYRRIQLLNLETV